MEFAVVDIETTGGMPQSHGITEIAIVIHNGVEVTGKYVTLVNPLQKIPPFIINMTGISDEMVAEAPLFEEVAPMIFNLLKDRIFVPGTTDPLRQSAGTRDGALSCLVGIAARKSCDTGKPVKIEDLTTIKPGVQKA